MDMSPVEAGHDLGAAVVAVLGHDLGELLGDDLALTLRGRRPSPPRGIRSSMDMSPVEAGHDLGAAVVAVLGHDLGELL
ncbi:hypothetical protein D9B85_15285, partial [Corynebacterium diphtheriae]